jgi:hypothetical protein
VRSTTFFLVFFGLPARFAHLAHLHLGLMLTPVIDPAAGAAPFKAPASLARLLAPAAPWYFAACTPMWPS